MESMPEKRQKIEEINQLERLSRFSTVVADTGEVNAIKELKPTDATTNPSLILKASTLPEYSFLVDEAVVYAKKSELLTKKEKMELAIDKVATAFGCEILKLVPGLVSTEVDARLSFNKDETVKRAKRIISLYKEAGVDKSRVLIKIAGTYEGIQAATELEKLGIKTNVTLIFSVIQAAACAEGGITLISPFVGRIMDWHKAKTGTSYAAEIDPGVLSVKSIYAYLKKFNFKTVVMGASFRNKGEILELAGCDKLTIAPSLLEELRSSTESFDRRLEPSDSSYVGDKLDVGESTFRFTMNEDAMATEKLAEGIRGFSSDIVRLEAIIGDRLQVNH